MSVETTKTTKFVWRKDGVVLVSVGDGNLSLTSGSNGGGGHVRIPVAQLGALKAVIEAANVDLIQESHK